MSKSSIGWIWVGAQAVLLLALVALPTRDDWPFPFLLTVLAGLLFFGGLILAAVAALGLGSSLTPTPVPNQAGELQTTGLYRFMRHPIYTAVLLVVAGITLRSQSWVHLVIAVGTVLFFDRKASWEEKQLAEHFSGYADYAARTPKFVPFSKSEFS